MCPNHWSFGCLIHVEEPCEDQSEFVHRFWSRFKPNPLRQELHNVLPRMPGYETLSTRAVWTAENTADGTLPGQKPLLHKTLVPPWDPSRYRPPSMGSAGAAPCSATRRCGTRPRSISVQCLTSEQGRLLSHRPAGTADD